MTRAPISKLQFHISAMGYTSELTNLSCKNLESLIGHTFFDNKNLNSENSVSLSTKILCYFSVEYFLYSEVARYKIIELWQPPGLSRSI